MMKLLQRLRSAWRKMPGGDDRGVALLLTLGVLALLLLIAMVFAFTANTDRMAASVNTDITKARLLCKSALERSLTFLNLYYKGNQTGDTFPSTKDPGANSFFRTSSTADWTNLRYLPSEMPTQDNDALLPRALSCSLGFTYTPATVPAADAAYTGTNADKPSWHHIKDGSGSLIGRLAFLVIDESGKLDPGAVVTTAEPYYDANGNRAYDAGEPYYDISGDGNYTAGNVSEGNEKRAGGSPQEIDLGGTLSGLSAGAPAGLANLFRSEMHANAEDWFSWHHMSRFFQWAQAPDDARILSRRLFPASQDIEAFTEAEPYIDADGNRRFSPEPYADRNGNGQFNDPPDVLLEDSGPLGWNGEDYTDTNGNKRWDIREGDFHRFDLSAMDWDNFDFQDVAALLTVPPMVYSATTPPATTHVVAPGTHTCIPWLKNLKADGTSGYSDSHLRKQVWANLIDYCDAEDPAAVETTNNYGQADWAAEPYVGLEMVPYLNEFMFTGTVAVDGTGLAYDFALEAQVELINIYAQQVTCGQIWLAVAFQYDVGGATWNRTHLYKIAGGNVNANLYGVFSATAAGSTNPFVEGIGINTGISNLLINSIEAYVLRGAPPAVSMPVLLDYAHITSPTPSGGAADSGGTTCYATVEAEDPRANTIDNDWSWTGFASAAVATGASSAPPYRNRNADPSTKAGTGDVETVTDPAAGLSTAFIRNAPPKSLWELGAIHRCEKWRTLNLTKYNDPACDAAKTYVEGDAAILDQVKLDPSPVATGKVNVNSPVPEVWDAVFTNIYSGAAYNWMDTPAVGDDGAALAAASVTALRNSVLAHNGSGTTDPYKGGYQARGAIADAITAVIPAGTPDAQREELLGKIANLLTARTNYFRVLVTGQAVKDVGTTVSLLPTKPSNAAKYYEDGTAGDTANDKWCTVLAEQKYMAIVYRDALHNTYKVVSYQALEN